MESQFCETARTFETRQGRAALISNPQLGIDHQDEQGAAVLDAVEGQLRPLLPLLLTYGVSVHDISLVFRSLYLESLAQRLQEQGRPATSARLALMAGMTRAEVESLRERRNQRQKLKSRATQRVGQMERLLALWHDDKRFSTPYGAPLDLSLQPEKGFRTFAEIVETAAVGADVSLVLDELLAAGAVEVHAERFVRCINRVFIPTGTDVSRIVRLGQQVAVLSDTIIRNLMRGPTDPSFYERSVVTGKPVKREFEAIAAEYLRTQFQQELEQLDRWWEAKADEMGDPAGSRYGVTVFFYKEPRTREQQTQDISEKH